METLCFVQLLFVSHCRKDQNSKLLCKFAKMRWGEGKSERDDYYFFPRQTARSWSSAENDADIQPTM